MLGNLPKPSSSQSPLYSVSALRRKLHALPCSSPHATRFAGLAREPHRLRPGADAPDLNFGTKCPKAEMPGNSTKLLPGRSKMWKVFSNTHAGHIIVLPPLKKRGWEPLKTGRFFGLNGHTSALLFKAFPVTENTGNPPPIRTPRTRRSFRCLLRYGCFCMGDLFHHALIGTVGKVHK